MKSRPPHSALRDLRAHLGSPATVASLAGATALLVLAGPFGTLESLGVAARTGYWGAVVLATYATGAALDIWLRPRLAGSGRAMRAGALTLTTAATVTLVVAGLNRLLLGEWPNIGGTSTALATIFAVGVITTLVLQLTTAPGQTAAAPEGSPPLLDRLPLDKRGPLIALSVEDHYVRVRTTRGEALLLMRLSDAIRETAPTPGLQVHRSHWVATAAVTSARRDGDRAVLRMTAGGDIPASRSHIPSLRDAGILPR